MEQTTPDMSEFNEAGFQIMRLNNAWQACHRYRDAGNLTAYRWKLLGIWIELSPDAKKLSTEETDFFKKKDKYDKLIRACIQQKNKTALFYILTDFEIFLKNLQNDSGKGSKYKDSAGMGLSV